VAAVFRGVISGLGKPGNIRLKKRPIFADGMD
jgi:hypothetical protein